MALIAPLLLIAAEVDLPTQGYEPMSLTVAMFCFDLLLELFDRANKHNTSIIFIPGMPVASWGGWMVIVRIASSAICFAWFSALIILFRSIWALLEWICSSMDSFFGYFFFFFSIMGILLGLFKKSLL
jgi:hypothetical protein